MGPSVPLWDTPVKRSGPDSRRFGRYCNHKVTVVYADTKATLVSDTEATYVAQLEEAEDRILHAFEDALESAEPDVQALLTAEMPKVRANHDRMRTLKQSMQ